MKKVVVVFTILLLTIVVYISLEKYGEHIEYKVNNDLYKFDQKQNIKSNKDLRSKVIDTYNIVYFDSIVKWYQNNNNDKSLLPYCILISNKWKDSRASYLVFQIFAYFDKNNIGKDIPNLDFLDEDTRELSIHYLINASEQGSADAKYI